MNQDQKIAEICKVLGVDSRVKIIRLLSERCLCVGALSKRLGITQGAVSQHLRILRSVDLVISEKRGYFVHYCVNEKMLQNWKAEINEIFEVRTQQK
ncbi:MAG: winged helix-turn-helix transcriptional regulator [Sedimentisphaerales bacterium]|nr:winged helix-turn-helix transcriptional regulator [Sedimentisphaerales bacterium]